MLQVGRADIGEVSFLRRVDVRGLDLDAIVAIEKGKILLYPDPASILTEKGQPDSSGSSKGLAEISRGHSARSGRRKGSTIAAEPGKTDDFAMRGSVATVPKPPLGEGLNAPAMLTFRRVLVKQRDDASAVSRRACGTHRAGMQLWHLPVIVCSRVGLQRQCAPGRHDMFMSTMLLQS